MTASLERALDVRAVDSKPDTLTTARSWLVLVARMAVVAERDLHDDADFRRIDR